MKFAKSANLLFNRSDQTSKNIKKYLLETLYEKNK